MRTAFTLVALTVSFAATAVSVRAQNFLNSSAETIRPGNFRINAFPTEMFGRNGGPDRFGGALRVGYGFDDSLGVEGKAAFFEGVRLLGADAEYRLMRGTTDVSVRAGGHQAVLTNAPDSTAIDLAAKVGHRFTRRLALYGGTSFSYEFLRGLPEGADSDFARLHLVPGVQYELTDRLAILVEAGVGLNDNSPHYVSGGFAVHVPTSRASSGGGRH
jgi:hypothetical protein